MKETGLMFKAPLVRAILEGRKTQTRRIVKPAPADDQTLQYITTETGLVYARSIEQINYPNLRRIRWDSPVGKPGDLIYVRETWAHGIHALAAQRTEDGPFVYAADGEMAEQGRLGECWKPSIHMPKHAARIWLEITGVRVERLQDISEADAEAEGIAFLRDLPDVDETLTAKELFEVLWQSTGGDWSSNPWVWVIDFKTISTTGRLK